MGKKVSNLSGALFFVCVVSAWLSTSASGLGQGRAYEMVSPVFKGGYGASIIEAVAGNGESVAFYSTGAFANAPSGPEVGFDYIARRESGGWSTESLITPSTLMPYVIKKDISPDLRSELALGKDGVNQEEASQVSTEQQILLHATDTQDSPGNWEPTGMIFKTFPEKPIVLVYQGASPDFCHVLLIPAEGGTYLQAGEEAGVTAAQLYEFDRGCGGEPVSLRRLAVDNERKAIGPKCQSSVGIGISGAYIDSFNAVADGGREIFFTTCVDGDSARHQLFLRLDGSKTIEVSKPVEEGCAGGPEQVPCEPGAKTRASTDFVGASEDGSVVYFETAAPLDPVSDSDGGVDLYMARIGCPTVEPACQSSQRVVTSLTQVSHDPNGGAADVQGVVRLAPDGLRAYFVARGDLLSAPQVAGLEAEGRATPHVGADNLYVYDNSSGETNFVGDLCTATELSGEVEDRRCPMKTGSDAPLWIQQNGGEAPQLAGADGRFIVFSTFAQLAPDDTDAAKDVYRYDAVTHQLERVSIGERGHDANGNDSRFNASIAPGHWGGGLLQFQYELDNRAVSEDGGRVVFTTAEPLSSGATNGLTNVYEWHEGAVSLISSGDGEEPVEDAVISAAGGMGPGSDVFFVTTQGLAPQDTDGAPDIYDARIGGGFSQEPAPPESCSGDGCQGPLTNPAPLLVPGSVAQAPGENFAPSPTPKKIVKVRRKLRSKGGRRRGRSTHKRRPVGRRGTKAGVR